MATSTIKCPPIINEVPVVGSKSDLGDIGVLSTSDEKTITLSNKTVSSTSTATKWDGITFSTGHWLCNLVLTCQSPGSTGNFCVEMVNSSDQFIWYTRQACGNPGTGYITLNVFFTLTLGESTTYYPACYQQSGSNRTCGGYFHAIKW